MKYTFDVHIKASCEQHYYKAYVFWENYTFVLKDRVNNKKQAYFIPLKKIRALKKVDRFYYKDHADFNIVSNEDI